MNCFGAAIGCDAGGGDFYIRDYREEGNMGYIYIEENFFQGWSSRSCVGQVDSNGYIYNDMNYISGWGSGACIGRVDYQTGFIYNESNVWNGWGSSACVGKFDEEGYIYKDMNTFSGFGSRACVGKWDSDGYVYTSPNYLSGWTSNACVGRADGIGEAAALLLIILPVLKEESNNISGKKKYEKKNRKNTYRQAEQAYGGVPVGNGEFVFKLLIGVLVVGYILYKIIAGCLEMFFALATVYAGIYICMAEVFICVILSLLGKILSGIQKKERIKKVMDKATKIQSVILGIVSAIAVLIGNLFWENPSVYQILSKAPEGFGWQLGLASLVVGFCLGFLVRKVIFQEIK